MRDGKKHIRMTRQKKMIIAEIQKACDHPDAKTVYSRVKKKLSGVSLATVYRNLEDMASNGNILKLSGTTQRARFDGNTAPHYHFHCVNCTKVEDIPVDPENNLDQRIGKAAGREVFWRRVDFFGVCSDCREAKAINA